MHTEWLSSGTLQKVVLVVTSAISKQVLERWTFDIQTDKALLESTNTTNTTTISKSEAAVSQEIQALIRQITASVTFLPLLNDTCTIDLLAYTDKESDVPFEWYVVVILSIDLSICNCFSPFVLFTHIAGREESDPRYITSAADVRLRSFSTNVHSVEALVSYNADYA